MERLPFEEWIFRAPTADASDIDGNLLGGMVTARSLAREMLQDGTDTMIFDDMRRILIESREVFMSSDRSTRIVILVLETKAEDQFAVAVQKKILAALPF